MNHWTIRIAAMSVAIGLGVRAAPAAAPADPFAADLTAAAKAVDEGDCAKALPLIRGATANPRFAEQPDRLATLVWSMGAECAQKQGAVEEAFEDARAGTAYPGAEDWLWRFRVELGIALDRPDDVVETLELLIHVRPEAVRQVDARYFAHFGSQTGGRQRATTPFSGRHGPERLSPAQPLRERRSSLVVLRRAVGRRRRQA